MKNTSRVFAGLLTMGVLLGATNARADWWTPSSDQQQRQQQEQLSKAANAQVGMPAITHFSEKRAAKDILEMRDQMIPTYTYLYDMNGGHVGDLLCNSLGYGIDGGAQFTNPMKTVTSGTDGITAVPQADPNGLFSPSSSQGTFILCKDPTPGSSKVLPIRSEPWLITSPFKLK